MSMDALVPLASLDVDHCGREVDQVESPDNDTIKMFVGQVPRSMEEVGLWRRRS